MGFSAGHFHAVLGAIITVPKRIVDGDAVARSRKLAMVQPVEWRGEIYGLLTLPLANGVFEADPRRVWADHYSYNRPDWTVEQVAKLLDELERVKILFRWTKGDVMWGFFVNGDAPGRLPPPSRVKHENQQLGPDVPSMEVAAFLAGDGEKKTNEESALRTGHVPSAAANGNVSRTGRVRNGYVGLGLGLGIKSMSSAARPARGNGNGNPVKQLSEYPGFESWWEQWPKGRRLDREHALRAWKRYGLEEKTGDVLAALNAWKRTRQWQKAISQGEVEFIPHPTTWLNKGRWKDIAVIAAGQTNEGESASSVECEHCGGSGFEIVDSELRTCRNAKQHRVKITAQQPGTGISGENS